MKREKEKPHKQKKTHSSACVLALPGFIFNVVCFIYFALFFFVLMSKYLKDCLKKSNKYLFIYQE